MRSFFNLQFSICILQFSILLSSIFYPLSSVLSLKVRLAEEILALACLVQQLPEFDLVSQVLQ